MSLSLVELIERLVPVLDDDAALNSRWAGAGDDEAIAAEMVALSVLADRTRRALLKRTAVLVKTDGDLSPTRVLLDAGWSHPMCARNRHLALALYGADGREETASALDGGAIRCEHASVILDAVRKTPAAHKDGVEEVLLDTATRTDPMVLGRAAGYAIRVAADAANPGERDAAAAEACGLHLAPLLDGVVDVRGTLTPAAGEALLAALAPLSVPDGPDDRRRAPQRRHDALEQLARTALASSDLPDHGGQRPNVIVHVDLHDLTTEHPARKSAVGDHPGTASAPWVGSFPLTEGAAMSCDATLTRIVVDRPHKDTLAAVIADQLPPALGGAPRRVLDVGRDTRLISPALRKALTVRDQGCTHPGCATHPAFCDAHHIQHWADGGPTTLTNLRLLCRKHHRAQHRHHSSREGP